MFEVFYLSFGCILQVLNVLKVDQILYLPPRWLAIHRPLSTFSMFGVAWARMGA